MLRSDFCDYSDLHIDFESKIDLLPENASENDKASFFSDISKINDINRQCRKS